MRQLFLIFGLFLFFSCEYLPMKKKSNGKRKPIATVLDKHLYKEDVATFFSEEVSTKDSLLMLKSIIENWAVKQLLLSKAIENNTQEDFENINKLVTDYKESLLLNSYKEKLIKQQLDTIVSEQEIIEFYEKNKQNFRLNEELIKVKYLFVGKNMIDKKEIIKLFKSNKIEDIEKLEKKQLSFKTFQLNDTIWKSLDNVLLKIPFSRNKMLKKSKFIKKEDSLGVYLVAVKGVLKRNDMAPLSYISPTIKQLILHKRKIELIREIEKIIIKDAVQNKSFKTY